MTTIYDIDRHYWLKKSMISPTFLDLIIPELQETDTLVDIGCGNGRLGVALHTLVERSICVDYSEELVDVSQDKYPDVEFQCRDANFGLPSCDVAVSNASIRKDGCKLDAMLPSLSKCRQLFFRIQIDEDMPGWADTSPLYSRDEILANLEPSFNVELMVESYMQGFSGIDYFQKLLKRIGMKPGKLALQCTQKGRIRIPRSYALVSAELK